jgi:hypothetical protein
MGRKAILDHAQIALARIKNGRSEKSSLLVGLRGVDKPTPPTAVILKPISRRF